MEFYDPNTEPAVFDIVWCKWPRREDKLGPGPWVRCVLVIDVRRMVDPETDTEYSLVTACYGTDALKVDIAELRRNLYITTAQVHALGLHKPTVFKLDLENRKRLAWSPKYFVPQGYVRDQSIIAGSLDRQQTALVLAIFGTNGWTFPLP